jgi:hypothetical protein
MTDVFYTHAQMTRLLEEQRAELQQTINGLASNVYALEQKVREQAEELAELSLKGVPNLDCLPEGDYLPTKTALDLLADYCFNKRAAMNLRASGRIEQALAYERDCDQIYGRLPEWAKW